MFINNLLKFYIGILPQLEKKHKMFLKKLQKRPKILSQNNSENCIIWPYHNLEMAN